MALPIDGSIVIEPNVCAIVGRVFCVRVGQNDVADLASGAPPSRAYNHQDHGSRINVGPAVGAGEEMLTINLHPPNAIKRISAGRFRCDARSASTSRALLSAPKVVPRTSPWPYAGVQALGLLEMKRRMKTTKDIQDRA